jgi:hypothetical protein
LIPGRDARLFHQIFQTLPYLKEKWVLVVLSTEVNQPGSEADHSLPSSSEVKEWSFISTASYAVYGRLHRKINAVFAGSNGQRKIISCSGFRHVALWESDCMNLS